MSVSILLVLWISITAATDAVGNCRSIDCIDDESAATPEGYLSLLQGSLKLKSKHQQMHQIDDPEAESANADSSSHDYDYWGHIFGLPTDIFVILVVSTLGLIAAYFICLIPAYDIHEETKQAEMKAAHRHADHHALAYILNLHPLEAENVEPRIHDCFEEDTYSLAIALLVRDFQSLARGEGNPSLKKSRIGYSLGLIATTTLLTISLVICTKMFVTPLQVVNIRDAYDKFESVMYNGHTYMNVNNKTRGISGHFNASAFDNLSDDEKTSACNIPFSQLSWLMVILLVWSITCVASIKKCFEVFMAIVVFGDTKEDMKHALVDWEVARDNDGHSPDDDEDSKDGEKPKEEESPPVMVITGLTMSIKVLFTTFVFLPELATTVYILWLGCRWLTATNDFGNLLSNAVALEFVLQIKCLLFYALVSERNRSELKYTGMAPPWPKEGAGYGTYFNTLSWATLAVMWVYLYVFHLQAVLPDYHWDVKQVCDSYLQNILTASGGSA